jgi:hypothetical protein
VRVSLVRGLWPAYGRSKDDDDRGPLLESLGGGEEVNRAVLSGLIAAEPRPDRSRDGDPITVLLLTFTAPDERMGNTATCCEVEILDSIADRHRRRLRAGRRVWVAGHLTGDGLWATSLGT